MNLDTDLTPFTKINSKRLIGWNVKWKITKPLEDNAEENLDDLGYGNDYLDTTSKAGSMKEKNDRLDFTKNFWSIKDNVNRAESRWRTRRTRNLHLLTTRAPTRHRWGTADTEGDGRNQQWPASGILAPRPEVRPKLLWWELRVQTAGLTENLRRQGISIGVRSPRVPHLSTKTQLYPTACKLQGWTSQAKQPVRQEYSTTHQKKKKKKRQKNTFQTKQQGKNLQDQINED